MLKIYFVVMATVALYCPNLAYTQAAEANQGAGKTPGYSKPLVNSYMDRMGHKVRRVDEDLEQANRQCLRKLTSMESRLRQRLQKTDSAIAIDFKRGDYQQYLLASQDWQTGKPFVPLNASYDACLDTLKTTLLFLKEEGAGSTGASIDSKALAQCMDQAQQLEDRLVRTTLIKQYIDQRKKEISAILQRYTHVPPGVINIVNKYKETVYYYRQQVQAVKSTLADKDKIELATITALKKIPSYQGFLAKHSELSRLFPVPAGYGTPAALDGLQSHEQVQQLPQKQVLAEGQGGQAFIDQQFTKAQSMIQQIQKNVTKYGQQGADMDTTGFNPDAQKTKKFHQRLVFGANLQFSSSTVYLPSTANLGLSIGYRLNDKSTAGVGISYIMGTGRGWDHIRISNQGIGLRSFIDWRIKNSWYAAGGFEENYLREFNSTQIFHSSEGWQRAALIGLERKYRINKKFQGQLQLFFNALYNQQIPHGEMIQWRLGYNFK